MRKSIDLYFKNLLQLSTMTKNLLEQVFIILLIRKIIPSKNPALQNQMILGFLTLKKNLRKMNINKF